MDTDNLKVGFLLFDQFHGRKDTGSSRIRGHWLIKNWPNAELFKQGQKYDVVIYQKAYFVDHARADKHSIKILDLCDPDFLHWGHRVREMIEEMNAVTTSTESLAEAIRHFTDKPVKCIPDRIDPEFHQGELKVHENRAEWVVWFGYSTGFDMLKPVLSFLKKNKLGLIVISDNAFFMPTAYVDDIKIANYPWDIKTINDHIKEADMVINPQSTAGKWKYKSNNKTLTGWALGMPVATTVEELERFIDPEERRKEVELRQKELREKWLISKSVKEYKELITDLTK